MNEYWWKVCLREVLNAVSILWQNEITNSSIIERQHATTIPDSLELFQKITCQLTPIFVNRKVQKDGFSTRQTSLVYYIQNIKHKLIKHNWSTNPAGLGRNLEIFFIIDIARLFKTKDKSFFIEIPIPYYHHTIWTSRKFFIHTQRESWSKFDEKHSFCFHSL